MIMNFKKPKLQFSNWIKWENRLSFELYEYPGVYMLAITEKDLENKPVDFEDVAYIGMTNSCAGLKGRWDQFNNSIVGRFGHSGGGTVYNELGDYEYWDKKLFVCACVIECDVKKESRTPDDLIKMGWVVFLEYEAKAKYKNLISTEPKYNKI